MKFEIKNRWTGDVQFVAEIDCAESELTSVKVGLSVKWAIKNSARLDGASLVRANLVRARLDGASLVGANLDGASFDGASLVGARLDGASLDGASLVGANLVGASLDGANLVGANLDDASLVRANLVRARLDGANLVGANLDGASFDGANLVGANLYGASLDGASLVGANLDGASLVGAKLIGEHPIIQMGAIGSRNSYLVGYLTDAGIKIKAGCWFGSVEDFEKRVAEVYANNEHGREYAAAIAFIKVHAEIWGGGI